VRGLRRDAPALGILVVDDGSGPRYARYFAAASEAGAEVIGYAGNRGKGHALKVGFAHILERHPGQDVVCADSDGQHLTDDIRRVSWRVRDSGSTIVLGGRRFAGDVPLRSRFGNSMTRKVFGFATGLAVHDTQTGLRGYPAALLPWLLTVKGERFEYELNTLLRCPTAGYRVEEIEIETVYLDDNASSHFRPVRDSIRVFAPLVRYASSSLVAFGIDSVGLLLLFALTNNLFVSVVGARLVSASVNFLVNRHVVFRAAGDLRRDVTRYVLLALGLLASNYVWLLVLTQWGMPLILAKFVTEAALYLISYQVQRRFVFPRGRTVEHEPARELTSVGQPLAAAFAARLNSRTLVSEPGSTMSATDR
jgi:putative flippase GtrA